MIKALFWEDSLGKSIPNSLEKRESYCSISQGVNPGLWLPS